MDPMAMELEIIQASSLGAFQAFYSFEWKGFLAASAKKRQVGKLNNFCFGAFFGDRWSNGEKKICKHNLL